MRRVCYALALILAAAPLSASAQRAGEMTLYSELGFKGQAYSLNGPRTSIQLAWTVRSIQVAPGESWEVCTQSKYRGTCVTVDRSEANIRRWVASGRPRGFPPQSLLSRRRRLRAVQVGPCVACARSSFLLPRAAVDEFCPAPAVRPHAPRKARNASASRSAGIAQRINSSKPSPVEFILPTCFVLAEGEI